MTSNSPQVYLINFLVQGMHTPILPMGFARFCNFLHRAGIPATTGQFSFWKAAAGLDRPVDADAGHVLPDIAPDEIKDLVACYYESIAENIAACDVLVFSGNPQVVWVHDLKLYTRALKYLLDLILKKHEDIPVFVGGGLVDCFKMIPAFSYFEVTHYNRYFFHNNIQRFLAFLQDRFGFVSDEAASVDQRISSHMLFPEYDAQTLSDYTFRYENLAHYLPERAPIHRPDLISSVLPVLYSFSVGCPNRCAFCEHSTEPCHYLSVDRIMDDLWRLRETYPYREVYFLNSQFMKSRRFCFELCRRMIDEKLDIRWSDSVSLSMIDEETAGIMAQSGCTCLWVGLESPSDRMLTFVGKKISTRSASKAIEILDAKGIWIGCNLILGMPYETDEEIEGTCRFISEHRELINAWQLNYFAVRRGSLFFKYPEKYGIRVFPNPDGEIPRLGHDEIDGLSWAERKTKTNRDYRKVFTEYLKWGQTWINMDPYLIFSLFRSLSRKQQVRRWMNDNMPVLSRCLPFGAKQPMPRK